MVEHLSPDTGLKIRVPRRVAHHGRTPHRADRHVLALGRREAVVTGNAVVGGDEERHPALVAHRMRRRLRVRRRGRSEDPDDGGTREETVHFQYLKKPPSNQSHSRYVSTWGWRSP